MTDIPRVSPNAVSPSEAGLRATRTVREVRASAAFAADAGGGDSQEVRAALQRLNRILASDQPLRANAPRGFYPNFTL
jgi:hypothetical protein